MNQYLNQQLLLASSKGLTQTCLSLLTQGADINCRQDGHSSGATPWMLAHDKGHAETALTLINVKGVKIDALYLNEPWLHTVAYDGSEPLAQALISKGVDLHAENFRGENALHAAVMGGQAPICRLLLHAGLGVNSASKGTETVLHMAARQGNSYPEVCQILIEHGAKVDVCDYSGAQPLHWAARSNCVQVCELLLQSGADIEALNATGWSPLHSTVAAGAMEAAMLLIAHGADLQTMDLRLDTLLHNAAKTGGVKMCLLILEHGADARVKNEQGETAQMLAQLADDMESARVIGSWQARHAARQALNQINGEYAPGPASQ